MRCNFVTHTADLSGQHVKSGTVPLNPWLLGGMPLLTLKNSSYWYAAFFWTQWCIGQNTEWLRLYCAGHMATGSMSFYSHPVLSTGDTLPVYTFSVLGWHLAPQSFSLEEWILQGLLCGSSPPWSYSASHSSSRHPLLPRHFSFHLTFTADTGDEATWSLKPQLPYLKGTW